MSDEVHLQKQLLRRQEGIESTVQIGVRVPETEYGLKYGYGANGCREEGAPSRERGEATR